MNVKADRLRLTGGSAGLSIHGSVIQNEAFITQSVFSNAVRGAHFPAQCTVINIENSLFFNNSFAAIDFDYARANVYRVRHNTFIGNATAVRDWAVQAFALENNLFLSNGTAVHINPWGGARLVDAASNLYWDNGTDVIISGAVSYSDARASDILADPGALRADWGPEVGSPAYNAAFASDITVDYWGKARPFGKASDIGAVETQVAGGTVIIVR